MATTSIWSVKGWLGKVVIYVENPEKTTAPEIAKFPRYENEGAVQREEKMQSLSDVIAYAVNAEKTRRKGKEGEEGIVSETEQIMQQYVSGINCTPATARNEMMAVKKRYGKDEGIVAFHGYQSFAPGECTPALAHEIGVRLAQELWGGRFQVLVATHLDKAHHLHNHFVVNSVSYLDGKRYHRTNRDYRDMRATSDRLCREYGLSVIEHPKPGKSRHYGEWRAEQEGRPTYHSIVREDVDEAILQARTEKQFFHFLREKGWVETETELWRGVFFGVDPKEDTGGRSACHPAGRTTAGEKTVCGACAGEPAEEKDRRIAGAVSALLFSPRYPAEEPPVCISKTTSFPSAGGSGETGTDLQRDKTALSLSHRHGRATFFLQRIAAGADDTAIERTSEAAVSVPQY